jgi:hypothetical protein
MGIQIQFRHAFGWPPLAWVAQCSDTEVMLAHGSRVEIAQDWFAEAVWPGAFEEGRFDQTDLVFGSGGRLSGGTVTFVSSGSTVDRLVSIQVGKQVYVSNSLVALCATLNLSVDPLSNEYYSSFRSIQHGLQKYKRLLQTTQGPLLLTYFHNLRWDGHSLDVTEKPHGNRAFSTFEEYRRFLEASLSAIGVNMRDPLRQWPYLPLGTLSTGYDSPTVAALARVMGNSQVLTFQEGREGMSDSGENIAARLGLSSIVLDRTAWRQEPFSEVPFLAANAYGEEMHFVAARSYLQGRVLLTGHHGDTVWGTGDYDLTSDIVRHGAPSGLALAEWRLWVGFLHCTVPFLSVRNIEQIHRVSISDEMKPWSVGGDYDRPICRRIVEEAGVERELFGQQKNATAVVLWNPKEGFLSDESMQDYARWLRSHVPGWLMIPLNWKINAYSLMSRVPGGWRFSRNPQYFFNLFPWALEHAKRRYMGMGSLF